MAFALGPQAVAAGYGLAAYERIDSTNSAALRRIRAGERGPLWIVTDLQSEGRGRRGRSWTTQPGNLAASLLLSVDTSLPLAATLGFVAALALRRALENATDGLAFLLKWPNDILVNGRKLAGILLESENGENGQVTLAVGLGVNVLSAPEDVPFPATSLAALGQRTSAEHVFAELSDAFAVFLGLWDNGRGLAAIRSQWLQHAAGLGQDISIRAGDGILQGIFRTLDEDGRLILQGADGVRRAVSAGDVYFGTAATIDSAERH